MTSPESPRPRRPFGTLRRLAAITALVVGAGFIGFTTTQAGAQSSGGLDAQAIAAQVNPAVVSITNTLAGGQGQAAGTGMVIAPSGEVITNNHVIQNAGSIRVRIGGSGRSHSAQVLGYNVREDIALLKVDGVSDLKTVSPDTTPSVGESVVALGNGGGRGNTADPTTGSVTAVGEAITVGDLGGSAHRLTNLIRTNASLQPGDSGGPLIDGDGEVIGVNTAASTGGFRFGSGSRTGFAIPIKTALSIANQIESGQGSGDTHVGERAFLGVSIRSGAGTEIADVQSGSPADKAGIGGGDEIVSLGGKKVRSLDDLTSALAPYHPRDKVPVTWTDAAGRQHTADVTLASGPPA
jgi:S1-C subfamily serine protease